MRYIRQIRRRAAIAAPVGLAVALSFGSGYAAYRLAMNNLSEVVAGEFYRSAQVDREDLAEMKRTLGIRSVLNLRGAQQRKDWYREELAASAELGLMHADFPMKASKSLTVAESLRLIALMASLPKPVLVHCRHGADRTGLASALYLAAVKGIDEEVASGQLSILYGHVALPHVSEGWPMSETWQRMQLALATDTP